MKKEKEFLSVAELVAKSIQGTGLKYQLWFDMYFSGEEADFCSMIYEISGPGKLSMNLMDILGPGELPNNLTDISNYDYSKTLCSLESGPVGAVGRARSVFKKYGIPEAVETICLKTACTCTDYYRVSSIEKRLFKPPTVGEIFMLSQISFTSGVKEIIDENTFKTAQGTMYKYWIVDEELPQ